jgi:hypothetical protein
MTRNNKNKGQAVVTATQFIAATKKHLGSMTQVPLLGSSFTPDQVTTKLQALVDLRSDVDAAKANATAKIANEAAQRPSLLAFQGALGTFVKAAFGSSPDVLADFGLAPKARAQVTVDGKAVANAKRAATRAARHTMGSKQKLSITGVVPDVLVISTKPSSPIVTAPAPATAPSSPTAPATSGSPTAASNPTSPATSAAPTAAATPHTA